MADKENSKTDQTRVFDVAKPGTSTPNTGSKPMVVGHKSIAIDPSMRSISDQSNSTSESNEPLSTEPTPSISSTAKKVITPPSEKEKEKTIEISDDDKNKVIDSDGKGRPSTDEIDADESKQTGNEVSSVESKSSASEEQLEELVEGSKSEEIQELIKSKKYFVRIESAGSSRFKKILLIILTLFFVMIGVYVLADMELIPGSDILPKRFLEPSSVSESISSDSFPSNEVKEPVAEQLDTERSFTPPEGFSEFKSSALGFSIWIPPTIRAYNNGLGDDNMLPEELESLTFGVVDKETTCCSFDVENIYVNENQKKELTSLFESGGLEAIAKESNRVNKEDKNVNLSSKTVSDVVMNTRGNVKTYEYVVTGSLSTGYFDDTQSATLGEEKTVVVFFKTSTGVVRIYGQLNDESEIILNTLQI